MTNLMKSLVITVLSFALVNTDTPLKFYQEKEARIARAYALSALEILPELLRTQGTSHARVAALWADLHTALRHPHSKPTNK